jgi:hypothetical protein
MKEIMSAIIGLVGTITVGLFGFYQWRETQNHTTQAPELEAKRKAHELLWKKLEEINVLLRSKDSNNPTIFKKIKEVNITFIENSFYLNDDMQGEIAKYIASMEKLRTLIYSSGDKDLKAAWRQTLIDVRRTFKEIDDASEEMKKLRLSIKTKLQNINPEI